MRASLVLPALAACVSACAGGASPKPVASRSAVLVVDDESTASSEDQLPDGETDAPTAEPAVAAVCPAFLSTEVPDDAAAWKHCPILPPLGGGEYFVCHHPSGCGRPCKVEIFSGSTDDLGYSIRYRYDDAGRLTQSIECQSLFSEQFTDHEYDAAGNIVRSRATGRGEWLTTYEYDQQGLIQHIRVAEQDGHVESVEEYRHDGEGRVVQVVGTTTGTGPLTQKSVTRFTYSPNGRIQTVESSGDAVSGPGTYRYEHDDRGRLAVVSWAQGQRRFEYNESGLLAELRERSESKDAYAKYAYDEQGRLVSIETDQRTLQYSYTCASTERDLRRLSPRPSFFPIPTDALKCN